MPLPSSKKGHPLAQLAQREPVKANVAVSSLKWAEETMLERWDRQMETSGLARIKVDLP